MKNTIINGGTKLILLHPYIHKQANPNRLWLVALISLFAIVALVTLAYTGSVDRTGTETETGTSDSIHHGIPKSVVKALVHYASNSNSSDHMSQADIQEISDVLRQCQAPCNFLVFGLTPETLLWNALNHRGRTVFIDENRYYAAKVEKKWPEIEVYDVQYTTKVKELKESIIYVREQAGKECRPVQNLLFSDCKIGLNDLPNELYEVDWDVILVDGPSGYGPEAPGRVSAVFTAGVFGRSRKDGDRKTHVLVHDYHREVERVSSEEFLCKENLVKTWRDSLAHFAVGRVAEEGGRRRFCWNPTTTSF